MSHISVYKSNYDATILTMSSNQRKDKRKNATSSDEDEPLIKRIERRNAKRQATASKRKATLKKKKQKEKERQAAYLAHLSDFASNNFSPKEAYDRGACPKNLVDEDRIDGGRLTGHSALREVTERITCQTDITDDLRRADGAAPELAVAMKMLEEDGRKVGDVQPEQDNGGRLALCLQRAWGL